MLTMRHDEKNKEFIVVVEGQVAALKYRVLPGREVLDYYSTFVPPEIRGHNIGRELVKFALDYAKDKQHQVIPSCPFVRHFIDEHPDYKTLIFVDVP